MNTRRNAKRRLEEVIANSIVPSHGDQVPPPEEDFNDDQDPVGPPLKDGAIRAQMAQAITTQAKVALLQLKT